jgi:hypothetical protein
LTLGAGDAPAVAVERFIVGFPDAVLVRRFIDNPSGRTLIMRDCQGVGSEFTGPGEIHLEGVEGRMIFHGQNVWAREIGYGTSQNSPEDQWWHLRNDGGRLWILGLSCGGPGTIVSTTRGGKTEILGAFAYSSGGASVQPEPAFVIDDGALSVSLHETSFRRGVSYPALVSRVTKDGRVDLLVPQDAPGGINGSLVPHFATE